jgi:hypothetical protein
MSDQDESRARESRTSEPVEEGHDEFEAQLYRTPPAAISLLTDAFGVETIKELLDRESPKDLAVMLRTTTAVRTYLDGQAAQQTLLWSPYQSPYPPYGGPSAPPSDAPPNDPGGNRNPLFE